MIIELWLISGLRVAKFYFTDIINNLNNDAMLHHFRTEAVIPNQKTEP